MPTKKNSYVSTELDWAEESLATWRQYIDNNPIDKLKDRVEFKQTKTGGVMPMVVSTIEQQIKSVQDTMKNYLSLLEIVNNLREKEEAKIIARGGKEISGGMMGKLMGKGGVAEREDTKY